MGLTVGFLGYGFMGRAHASAIDRLPLCFPDAPDVKRDVLIGRDVDRLATAADRFGFDRTATDWRDAVDEVDVFYNLGPNHVHVEPCIAALRAGTAVLCEKPLAPTLAGAQRLAAVAGEADVPAATAFNYRYLPAIQYAKRRIDAGDLGDIRQFRASYQQDWLVDQDAPWSWRTDEELAGSGALGDLGSHTVDLARFLVGDRAGAIDRVSGHLRTFVDERPVERSDDTRQVTVDDACTAQLAFEGGALGTLSASRIAPGHTNALTVRVEGSDGALLFDLERPNELQLLTTGDRGFQRVLVTDEDDPYMDHWWPPGHTLGWEHAVVHENYELLSAVGNGDGAIPSMQDGLAAQRVLAAVERSDESGEWVDVA